MLGLAAELASLHLYHPTRMSHAGKKTAFSLMQPPRDSLLEDLTRGGTGFPLGILLSLSSS